MKIWGYGPSDITDSDPSGTRDLPLFYLSGLNDNFGGMPVCLYVYSGNNWVPCYWDWLA